MLYIYINSTFSKTNIKIKTEKEKSKSKTKIVSQQYAMTLIRSWYYLTFEKEGLHCIVGYSICSAFRLHTAHFVKCKWNHLNTVYWRKKTGTHAVLNLNKPNVVETCANHLRMETVLPAGLDNWLNLSRVDPDEEVQGEIHLALELHRDAQRTCLHCHVIEARWAARFPSAAVGRLMTSAFLRFLIWLSNKHAIVYYECDSLLLFLYCKASAQCINVNVLSCI